MAELEESNSQYAVNKARLQQANRKMRLERAILLEALAKRVKKNNENDDEDSEGSSEGPPTVSINVGILNRTNSLCLNIAQRETTPHKTRSSASRHLTSSGRRDSDG